MNIFQMIDTAVKDVDQHQIEKRRKNLEIMLKKDAAGLMNPEEKNILYNQCANVCENTSSGSATAC